MTKTKTLKKLYYTIYNIKVTNKKNFKIFIDITKHIWYNLGVS